MLQKPDFFFLTKRRLSEIKAELLPAFFKSWAEGITEEELFLADLNAISDTDPKDRKAIALQIREDFQEPGNATENETKTLTLFLSDPAKAKLEKLKQSLENPAEEEAKLPENITFLNSSEAWETLEKLLPKVPGLLVGELFSYAPAQELVTECLQNSLADLFLLFDFRKLEKTFLAPEPTVLISSIFGADLGSLQDRLQAEKSPKRREQLLMESLESRFYEAGLFPLRFKINPPGKTGSTTYLLLAGSNQQTYFRAKEWLQTYSEFQEDGVPLFGVNLNYQPAAIPGFSGFLNQYSLEALTREMGAQKAEFHYHTIREIYEAHSLGTNYVLANYIAAFRNLRKMGTVNLVDANNKKVANPSPASVVFYRLHR